jgi:hypothetical protein
VIRIDRDRHAQREAGTVERLAVAEHEATAGRDAGVGDLARQIERHLTADDPLLDRAVDG